MKKTFTLILSFLIGLSVFAIETRLSITSVSSQPVRIMVDGRNYSGQQNSRNEVFIRDIRPGYHTIKVYQQRNFRPRPGQHSGSNSIMRVLYEGRVFVRQGTHVDIVINRFGKALIDERQIASTNYHYDDYNEYDNQYDWNTDFRQAMDAQTFEQLKQTIRNEGFDNTRMSIAKQAIGQQYVSTAQVKELVQLFSFENSKLDLAKYCYSRTVDKGNYFMINDVFSFSSSKQELSAYIQANP